MCEQPRPGVVKLALVMHLQEFFLGVANVGELALAAGREPALQSAMSTDLASRAAVHVNRTCGMRVCAHDKVS